jgi:hypothetical protein
LFSSIEQLQGMLAKAGLAICDELVLPYQGVSLEEAEARSLAINVAFRLRKA